MGSPDAIRGASHTNAHARQQRQPLNCAVVAAAVGVVADAGGVPGVKAPKRKLMMPRELELVPSGKSITCGHVLTPFASQWALARARIVSAVSLRDVGESLPTTRDGGWPGKSFTKQVGGYMYLLTKINWNALRKVPSTVSLAKLSLATTEGLNTCTSLGHAKQKRAQLRK